MSRFDQLTLYVDDRKKSSWSIADAFFAPVAIRFHVYAVALGEQSGTYLATQLDSPTLREWIDIAQCRDATGNN